MDGKNIEVLVKTGPWDINYTEDPDYGTLIESNIVCADICYKVTSDVYARAIRNVPTMIKLLLESQDGITVSWNKQVVSLLLEIEGDSHA